MYAAIVYKCVCVGACVGLMRYPGNCCDLCLNLSLICGLQSAQYIYLCVDEVYNLFTYVLLWCRMYLPMYTYAKCIHSL